MERDEKQRAEGPHEKTDVAVDHDAATKGLSDGAEGWGGTEDPAFYLKPSDEE